MRWYVCEQYFSVHVCVCVCCGGGVCASGVVWSGVHACACICVCCGVLVVVLCGCAVWYSVVWCGGCACVCACVCGYGV